jgi:hypothetical protein
MKGLGFIFLVSWMLALFFYGGFVVSVWCYFAALMSIIIIWILAGMNKSVVAPQPG